MKLKKYFVLTAIFSLLLISACNTKPVSEEEKANQQAKSEFVKEVGKEPDKQNSDEGSDQYVYENTKYLDYVGTSTYYFTSGVVVFSKWETDYLEKKEAEKIYNDIVENESSHYKSKGSEVTNGENKTYSLAEGNDTATILLSKEGDRYKVGLTQTGKKVQDFVAE